MRILNALMAVLLLAYPLVIYFGLNYGGLNVVALMLLLIFVWRLVAGGKSRLPLLRPLAKLGGLAGVVLVVAGVLLRHEELLLFYPVVMNSVFLIVFAASLRQSQTMIERFARLEDPELSAADVRYTRIITIVWTVFFVLNGTVALATCFMPLHVWTLYNGLISYLLVGTLFFGERLARDRLRTWVLS